MVTNTLLDDRNNKRFFLFIMRNYLVAKSPEKINRCNVYTNWKRDRTASLKAIPSTVSLLLNQHPGYSPVSGILFNRDRKLFTSKLEAKDIPG